LGIQFVLWIIGVGGREKKAGKATDKPKKNGSGNSIHRMNGQSSDPFLDMIQMNRGSFRYKRKPPHERRNWSERECPGCHWQSGG
jgi:hypothetical protein